MPKRILLTVFSLLQAAAGAYILWHNLFGNACNDSHTMLSCSRVFVIMGVLALLLALLQKKNPLFPLLMALALLCGALGDKYLGGSLPLGAGLFALQHTLMIAGSCILRRPGRWVFPPLILLSSATVGLILFHPDLFIPDTVTKILCVFYALLISTMCAFAIGAAIDRPRPLQITAALGAVLFFTSDLLLFCGWFWAGFSPSHRLSLSLYFAGQILLALSSHLYSAKTD